MFEEEPSKFSKCVCRRTLKFQRVEKEVERFALLTGAQEESRKLIAFHASRVPQVISLTGSTENVFELPGES